MMAEMRTWREMITWEMHDREDNWANAVHCTLSDDELDVAFDSGFGGPEGKPFLLWTKDRVYFPAEYDGSESVESVPRNPQTEAEGHK